MAHKLVIHDAIREKLANKHKVTPDEVSQCFSNREAGFLLDEREDHQTNPPTLWFISETFWGRKLKVVFMMTADEVIIKTCYPAHPDEIAIYQRRSVPRQKVASITPHNQEKP